MTSTNQKTYLVIKLVAWVSMFAGFLWGLYFVMPSWAKAVYSASMIIMFFLFPYSLFRNNDFDKKTQRLMALIGIFSVIQVFRSVLDESAAIHAFGNKWLTLFGNEYCMPLLIPLLFVYLGSSESAVKFFQKQLYAYMLIGVLFMVVGRFALSNLMIFMTPFLIYMNKKNKILYFIVVFQCLWVGWLSGAENLGRSAILYIAFAMANYILAFRMRNDKLSKIYAVGLIVAPVVMFLPMMAFNFEGESLFSIIGEYVTGKSGDDQMGTDTRTFLYLEMAEDLYASGSWLFGKGAFCHYYSDWFDEGGLGKFGRIGIEVPFLNMLMHGGLTYVFCYYAVFVIGIVKALWRGQNYFVKASALMLSGWVFASFICDTTGCRFYHMGVYMLLGCCLSRNWLEMTNDEVSELLTLK